MLNILSVSSTTAICCSLFQEPEAKGPAPWGQSAGGFGGLPHFENRFGGGGMFQPPPFPPQRGLTNGTNNPNVIVVDTNQLTTRYPNVIVVDTNQLTTR